MMRVLSNGVVPVKVWTDEIEETALQQLRNLSQLPFVHKHVAVMPDVHAGYGSTVGSVIPTKAGIIPAAVGVDSDCGTMAQRLPLTAKDLPDDVETVRFAIEAGLPH
jgi:tRNA-splicing ligase RtcB (3'-phosphate/5'-hydroxy nucleic acid ligase)